MNALPNFDTWLTTPPDDIDLPELDSDELADVLSDLTTEYVGTEASEMRDALSDQIATLADAHWMLDQLFQHDITVAQLFERQKQYPDRITSLRTLRNLTAQMSQRFDELTELAQLAKHEEAIERAEQDAAEARAA